MVRWSGRVSIISSSLRIYIKYQLSFTVLSGLHNDAARFGVLSGRPSRSPA